MAPASALVTVTVLEAAGGVINKPGEAVADGMTMSPQSGGGTAGTDWVGFGVGDRAVPTASAHPAAIAITAAPTSVDRRMDAMSLTVATPLAAARFLQRVRCTHLSAVARELREVVADLTEVVQKVPKSSTSGWKRSHPAARRHYAPGDAVAALGNALGRGGLPVAANGFVVSGSGPGIRMDHGVLLGLVIAASGATSRMEAFRHPHRL